MAKYVVTGIAGGRAFEKQLDAASEKMAREKAYSLLGANAGIKRQAIEISSVDKV